MGVWFERRRIGGATFCPWCGVNRIQRYDKDKQPKNNSQGVDFWCLVCGASFRLDKSLQHRQADELHQRDRSERPSNDR